MMILPVLAFLTGIGLLLYPTVSDLWNTYHQTQAIITYAEQTSGMDEETRRALWDAAEEYNETLAQKEIQYWVLSDEEQAVYDSLLSITAKGTMGYVEIPCIDVMLPIYHGTGEAVLQEGIGHLEGSSLPVGGESTHTVLSGHRGLPSSRLFTDLDKMQEGDLFYLHVLGETLAYEVDQILTVEPEELEELKIVEGEDYCTLFTCTPYGINTHRLLVRGHRVETPPEAETDGSSVDGAVVWTKWIPVIGAAAALVLLILIMILLRKRRRRKKKG